MRNLSRRTLLGGLTVGLASTSGCLGFATGDDSLTFEADPARVSEQVLSETKYEETERRSPTIAREFTVAGQSREVEITNHLGVYEKAVELEDVGSQTVALFALFTTPRIEIAGESFNPVGEVSVQDLLEQFQSRYDGVDVGEKVDSSTVQTLGTEATVEKYTGSVTMQGEEIDAYLQVTRFEHDGDYVVGVGSYPQQLQSEGEQVRSLIAGIEH